MKKRDDELEQQLRIHIFAGCSVLELRRLGFSGNIISMNYMRMLREKKRESLR